MIYIYILIKIALLSTKVIFSTNLRNLTAVKTNCIITGVELPYTKAKENKQSLTMASLPKIREKSRRLVEGLLEKSKGLFETKKEVP